MYKNKYAIGIYKKIRRDGDTDELVKLMDNAEEFASFIGKSIKNAYAILWNHLKGKQHDIRVKNNDYELALIDMKDE